MKKSVVLVSGGLDSATTLAIAKDLHFSVYALTFRYGQRHECEIESAKSIARELGVAEHIVMGIELRSFGGSALTDDIKVPKDRPLATSSEEIPVTYVPARNTIFLSVALAWAEVLGGDDVFIGVNALDYSGYPDCRPEYIRAFQTMANLATKAGVEGKQSFTIHTPLIEMSKSEIIRKGISLGVDFSLTHSCYDPDNSCHPCGRCDACRLRRKGFRDAGAEDPLTYPE
jgi:7-cyano-7-deazaguanine synthase